MAGEEESPQAEDVAELRGFGNLGGLAFRLELGDAPLDVADERPRDRLRRGQRALGERRDARVADADPKEPSLELVLDLIGGDIELVPPDAGDPDVEDEIRIAHRGEARDQRGLI